MTMPTDHLPEPFAAIAAAGRITAEDVLAIRRTVFPDGVLSRDEAEAILALNEACAEQDPAWGALFVEALVDHVVRQAAPAGYVDQANADWLMDRLTRDGRIDTATELDLLVKVLETATSVPEPLAAFALDQVKRSVLTGDGPTRSGQTLAPGVIGAGEVALLRRILYAATGENHIGVSRAEAEVLFDINDATRQADNDPAWSDLFVKAIANHLMASFGYVPPSREEALRREAWLDKGADVDGFMSRLLTDGLQNVAKAYRGPTAAARGRERQLARETGVKEAEAVTLGEAAWLEERIGRDGTIHDNEKALLAFIEAECPDIYASLKMLIDKVGSQGG